jgi:hypothetical protein
MALFHARVNCLKKLPGEGDYAKMIISETKYLLERYKFRFFFAIPMLFHLVTECIVLIPINDVTLALKISFSALVRHLATIEGI